MELRRTATRWLSSIPVLLLAGALGCTGSGSGAGVESQALVPCNDGQPAFDVWHADFAPVGRPTLTAGVDTENESTAAGFRLVVACNGIVVIDTTGGAQCSHTPPHDSGPDPECPQASADIGDLASAGRVECFAEIGSTAALGVGNALCADAQRADYNFRMRINDAALGLDLAADDCRADESCLQEQFGIDVGGG